MSDATAEKAHDVERNMLTRAETFRLMTWLSCQRDRLLKERPVLVDIAKEAAEALKFAVSKGNVSGCLSDLEIEFHPARKAGSGLPGGGKYLAAERERIDNLIVRIEQLEGRVSELAATLAAEQRERKALALRVGAVEKDMAPFSVMGRNGEHAGKRALATPGRAIPGGGVAGWHPCGPERGGNRGAETRESSGDGPC